MTMRMFAAALAAGMALGGPAALAQATTGALAEPDTPERETVERGALERGAAERDALALTDDQAQVLRHHIRHRPVERIVQIPGGPARPGRVVPRSIRLSPLAHVPVDLLSRYAYVVSPDDKIIVVDPTSRRVVHVLDR